MSEEEDRERKEEAMVRFGLKAGEKLARVRVGCGTDG